GDISVGNGSTSNLSGSGTTYTATITPTADGQVTVNVAANAAQDIAGNINSAAIQFLVTNDQTAPTVSIAGPAGPVSGAFTASFTFSEVVSGFALGDISVGNGAASNLSGAGTTYTATITPASDGLVTIDVAANVAQDVAGNNNTAATQFSVTNDSDRPTLTITGPAGPVAGAFTATFTFSENVTGFVLEDITVGNGTASNLSGAGTTYTATITPTADGQVTIDVAANIALDAASNPNTAATQFTVTNDSSPPTVTITGPTGPVAGAFTATITFSKTVTGFAIGDISVGNGSASNLSGSGTTYTATITPTTDGQVTVNVSAGAAQDAGGNANTAAIQFAVTNDETAPTLSISGPSGPVSGAFTASFTFSEDVTGFTLG
ncbi:Ig-like domain-containing protein, partial [Hyphobacterium sp. HN65]